MKESLFFRHSVLLLLLSLAAASVGLPPARAFVSKSRQKGRENPRTERLSSHVVLLIVSGLGSQLVNRTDLMKQRAPFLQGLIEKGARAWFAESVYPSLTLPAHASIATGTLPADHSITSDAPFDEKTGAPSLDGFRRASEIKGEAIWDIAARNGLTAAAIGFPLTEGARIKYLVPAAGKIDQRAGWEPLLRSMSPETAAEGLRAYIKTFKAPGSGALKSIAGQQQLDFFRAAAASYLIEGEKPGLTMVSFSSFAAAAETAGPESGEAPEALRFIDALIAQIGESIAKAGIGGDTTLIVASDHGMSGSRQVFDPNALLAKKGFEGAGAPGWKATAAGYGGSAAIYINPQQDRKLEEEVFSLLESFSRASDSPIWKLIRRNQAARLGADPTAAFYIDAAPGYSFRTRARGPMVSKGGARGVSGGLPSRSELRSVLILSGSGIKPEFTIEYGRVIDIAPTIARILGIEMTPVRGRILSEALTTK